MYFSLEVFLRALTKGITVVSLSILKKAFCVSLENNCGTTSVEQLSGILLEMSLPVI